MSKIYKKIDNKSYKTIGDHNKYLSRITKTLYYGKLPETDSLSLPVTELAAEIFSNTQKGKSLERLHCNDAAKISRNACVSPCSLVLAILYLERLKVCNPDYLERISPSDLFLVSIMVSSKFLVDEGESDEVFIDEWAVSGGISVEELVQLEKEFLQAIDWEIYVSELTFWKKLNEIETALAAKQGTPRGYYTYTELLKLGTTIDIRNIIHCVVAVSAILVATYTAGLLTLISSVFLVSQIPGTSLYIKKLDSQSNNDIPVYDEVLPSKTDIAEVTKTEFDSKYNRVTLDAVDVLKTGILLASIKSLPSYNLTNNSDTNFYLKDVNKNVQYISWDYWNIPVMDWLAKTSQFVTSLNLPVKYYPFYIETAAFRTKYIELEDQIHKATKTRIQDQMESSWHKEWTDSITYSHDFNTLFPYYLYNMKIKS